MWYNTYANLVAGQMSVIPNIIPSYKNSTRSCPSLGWHLADVTGYLVGFFVRVDMSKRKTTEQFIEEAREVHGNKFDYSLVEYVGFDYKVKIICPTHGVFEQYASAHLRGHDCKLCASEKRKKTDNDYHNLAKKRNFKWLGVNVRSTMVKTWWECKHGHKWETSYNTIANGKGCPYCAKCVPKTESDYLLMAESNGLEWVGPLPRTTREKSHWKCKKGHIWYARIDTIRDGKGCPYCSSTRLLPDSYKELARERGFEWLGPTAKNNQIKTGWKCQHGHIWDASYSNIKGGKGCPYCSGNARITPEDYKKVADKFDIEWLGPEVRITRIKTWWRCQYGHKWKSCYDVVKRGYLCPTCNQSKGEKSVSDFLDSLNIEYETEKRFDHCRAKKPLPFDFYFSIGNHNILIEYDGPHHFVPVEYFGGEKQLSQVKRHDSIKNTFAKNNGFILIRIPYFIDHIETFIYEQVKKNIGIDLFKLIPQNKYKHQIKKNITLTQVRLKI